tara:strand:- start:1252 stop:1641 length:390 start_codon:yes stop_codon:yes gene_type:complete
MNKKDPNYVVKLEKAIADKYGKEAVQNPKSEWSDDKEKQYQKEVKDINHRLYQPDKLSEKINVNGVFISKKLLTREANRTCPICGKYNLNSRDEVFIIKWLCCEKCYIKYVEDREDRWKKGWRPNNGKR